MVDDPVEIVARCQEGDREAQRQLYEIHSRKIFQLMRRMAGNEDAADLTQQVFLRVFQNIGQFTGRSRFETWMYRLAVNECLDHLRERGRHGHGPLEQEPASDSLSHTVQIEHKDLLEQALSRLDAELRTIFVLREVGGLRYREIAEALQLSDGTVASRLNRARRQLKQHLVELGWDG